MLTNYRNSMSQAFELWSHKVVIDVADRGDLNDRLYPVLLSVYEATSLGDEHYEREPHNLFDGSETGPLTELRDLFLQVAKEHYPIEGQEYEIDAHEIVSHDKQFIKTHVDSEEGDITLQYFVCGPAENEALEINSFGNAAFVLVNPARWPGAFVFDNERHLECPVLPRAGLLVMYRSYVPHYQQPYYGNSPMVQVVCNIKMKRKAH